MPPLKFNYDLPALTGLDLLQSNRMDVSVKMNNSLSLKDSVIILIYCVIK